MEARAKNVLDAFLAMSNFNTLNSADYANLPEAAAKFGIIQTAIEAMQNHAKTQTSGVSGQAVAQKQTLAAAIRRKMKRISETARALNIDDEGFARLFNLPNDSGEQKLLASARTFVEEATKHQADFLRLGLPENLVDDLTDDIEAHFNVFTQEQAREVISNIFPIFPVADKLLGTIAKTGLDADVPQLLADFKTEFRELREMLHDLSRFKANDTSEWDETFKN